MSSIIDAIVLINRPGKKASTLEVKYSSIWVFLHFVMQLQAHCVGGRVVGTSGAFGACELREFRILIILTSPTFANFVKLDV